MKGDDRNEGVNPHFAPVLEALLDAPVVLQTKHLAVRGKRIAKCGTYEGQITSYRTEVTCDACKTAGARR